MGDIQLAARTIQIKIQSGIRSEVKLVTHSIWVSNGTSEPQFNWFEDEGYSLTVHHSLSTTWTTQFISHRYHPFDTRLSNNNYSHLIAHHWRTNFTDSKKRAKWKQVQYESKKKELAGREDLLTISHIVDMPKYMDNFNFGSSNHSESLDSLECIMITPNDVLFPKWVWIESCYA